MKKTSKKKPTESKASANPPPPAAPAASPVTVGGPYPDPEALYHEAVQEEDQAVLRQYASVIGVLRGKNFSYREIADWLNKRGFKTDRNEVYRIYSKILRPDEEAHEAQAAGEEDRDGM